MEYKALGEIATVTSSKRIFAEQYVNDGIPFYRQKEIIEKHDKKQISDPLFISNDVYENIKTKYGIPKKGDLLLSAVGVTLGIPYIVQNEQFYFKDGNLIWLKDFNTKINSKYIYYWIDSKFGLESIFIRAIGSAQPALTIDLVKKYKIFFPKKTIQDKIANILSRYDEAIENNNKRIKLLEQMAQNLYKEWFVRFRFPGYEKCEFENGIPKGWKIVRLRDIAKDVGQSITKDEIDYNNDVYIPIDCIPNHQMVLTEVSDIENAESSLQKFSKNDILFGAMRVYFHKVILAPMNGVTRTTCFVINSKDKIMHNYLYSLLFNESTINYANTISVGATMPYVRWNDFMRMYCLLPSNDILEKYNNIIEPIFTKILGSYKLKQNLSKQRDLLLPRLISGKLEV